MKKNWESMSNDEKSEYMHDYVNKAISKITKEIYQESNDNKESLNIADIKYINIVTGLLVRSINIYAPEEEDHDLIYTIIDIINKNIPEALSEKAIMTHVKKINKISKLSKTKDKEIVN